MWETGTPAFSGMQHTGWGRPRSGRNVGGVPPAAFLRATSTRSSWADARCSLLELIFETVHEALERSELPFAEVDSVVLAAHDMIDGRSLTSMTTAPPAGAYLREEIRFSEDGAAALSGALARLQAGHGRNVIVAAWGRASEGEQHKISRALFDPFFARPLGLTELTISGLRTSIALREFGGYAEHRERAASRRHELACDAVRGPARADIPFPLREEEVAAETDVVCAMILTTEPTDIEVAGTGTSSEPYWPGDRRLLDLPALREAQTRALRMAGRDLAEVGHFEVDGATLFDEALALEAVGAAPRGDGMALLADGAAVNADGGYAAGACSPAMGLVRIAAAAEVLRGGGDADVALATGSSTVAGQVQIATVLARA